MKQLFDELNAILPNSPGSKSSKWEILTKCEWPKTFYLRVFSLFILLYYNSSIL